MALPLAPSLAFGTADRMPPNMITLIVWKRVLGIPIPITMHFPVMPESYMILKKYLTVITPTRGGGWVDDYGEAPSPITISGSFGYNTKGYFGQASYNGFGWVKYLEWLVDISHESDDGEIPEVWMMSHASQHYYEVVLADFNLSQKVPQNVLWKYELKITTLRKLSADPLIDGILSGIVEGAKITGGAIKSVVRLVL